MDAGRTVTPVFVETAGLTPQFEGDGAILADGVPVEELTTFDKDTTLQLEAVPDEGWRFDHWEGALSGSTNPESLAMDADKTVKAVFIKTYQLEVIEFAGGSVDVVPAPDPLPDPYEGIYTYDVGTQITCTATAGNGFRFQRWEGHVSGEDDTVTVTMNADKTVAARFIARVQLTMAKEGQGTITPAEGTDTYDFQTLVDVTATPAGGWMFMHWLSDAVEDPLNGWTEAEAYVVADMPPPGEDSKTVTAVFEEERTLTTAVSGPDGCGSINPSSGARICPDGFSVIVTATANEGYTFERWAGSLMGYTNPASVLMNADVYATAVFEEEIVQIYTLTVELSGEGQVTPAVGTYTYNEGTTVGLLLTSIGAEYSFDHWECDGEFLSDQIWGEVLMDADKTVKAVLVPRGRYTLTVETVGSGLVGVLPVKEKYSHGEPVKLLATPSNGWLFDHWEMDGEAIGESPSMTLPMYQNFTVTAVFVESSWTKYDLTIVTIPGDLDHLVVVEELRDSGDGIPIYYPTDSRSFDPGAQLLLKPDSNRFLRWTGALEGTDLWRGLVMDSDKTVTVRFETETSPGITVIKNGTGTVSLQPPSSDFGLPEGQYPEGTRVTIYAYPNGDDSMLTSLQLDRVPFTNGGQIMIGIKRHTLIATFEEARMLTVDIEGQGSVVPESGKRFPLGTEIVLQALPAPGWGFGGWEGDDTLLEAGSMAQLTMSDNMNLTLNLVELQTFTLTTAVLPDDSGYVGGHHIELDPAPPGPDGQYWDGDKVTLIAVPEDETFSFDQWGEDLTGSDNPATITMDSNKYVTAKFLRYSDGSEGSDNPVYEFKLRVSPSWGLVNLSPEPFRRVKSRTSQAPGWLYRCLYHEPEPVTVTPDGSMADFCTGIYGGTSIGENKVVVTPEPLGESSVPFVSASFDGVPLYISVTPEGGGTTDPEPGLRVYERSHPAITMAKVTADAEAGYEFREWSWTIGSSRYGSTANPWERAMPSGAVSVHLTAHFKGLDEGGRPEEKGIVIEEAGSADYSYGIGVQFIYENTAGWWCFEEVVHAKEEPPGNCRCYSGPITFNDERQPMPRCDWDGTKNTAGAHGCIYDSIKNSNGPPWILLEVKRGLGEDFPCSNTTQQVAYVGPSKSGPFYEYPHKQRVTCSVYAGTDDVGAVHGWSEHVGGQTIVWTRPEE